MFTYLTYRTVNVLRRKSASNSDQQLPSYAQFSYRKNTNTVLCVKFHMSHNLIYHDAFYSYQVTNWQLTSISDL